MMAKPAKIFVCSVCGAKIKNSKANLVRHEKVHAIQKKRIKCSAKNCASTFSDKGCYYTHWNNKHNGLIMPDGFEFVTENTKKYKMRYQRTIVNNEEQRPPQNDFFVLNYLGLTQIQSQNITVPQPYAGPFFGKLV